MLDKYLKDDRVTVWTKEDHYTKTGDTKQVRELLGIYGFEYNVVSVNQFEGELRTTIILLLGYDTGFLNFPNVYFGRNHIGGIDDIKSHLVTKESRDTLKKLL